MAWAQQRQRWPQIVTLDRFYPSHIVNHPDCYPCPIVTNPDCYLKQIITKPDCYSVTRTHLLSNQVVTVDVLLPWSDCY